MRRTTTFVLVPVFVLSLLAGCASEPNAPIPDAPEPQVVGGPILEKPPELARPRNKGTSAKLTIRLKGQRFEYAEGGKLVHAGEVSSGSREHPTPKGSFRVLNKEKDKRSGKYTNAFDDPTPMPYAIQFSGPYYVHEGWLPGHADSHGCVRLHYEDAKFLFSRIRVGDRVTVAD
jgi:lipoprotein-anchoring transpeptidase ErfK/SrfK